jgi:hypothetical protein
MTIRWRDLLTFSLVVGVVYTVVLLGAAGFFEAVP